MLQKKTEEAEKKRIAAVFEQQRVERIRKEIEERELEEAQALLQETEKHLKKGKKKPILDGVSNHFFIKFLIHMEVTFLTIYVYPGEIDKANLD